MSNQLARSTGGKPEAALEPVGAAGKLNPRLWLRMLACVNIISAEIRRRLREEYNVTLPQFDVLAQLAREGQSLRIGELSRRLMVTNGNLTGLVDKLVEAGFVVRESVAGDRRVQMVRMTAAGATLFKRMAISHEQWLDELLAGIDEPTQHRLIADLQSVKRSASRTTV